MRESWVLEHRNLRLAQGAGRVSPWTGGCGTRSSDPGASSETCHRLISRLSAPATTKARRRPKTPSPFFTSPRPVSASLEHDKFGAAQVEVACFQRREDAVVARGLQGVDAREHEAGAKHRIFALARLVFEEESMGGDVEDAGPASFFAAVSVAALLFRLAPWRLAGCASEPLVGGTRRRAYLVERKSRERVMDASMGWGASRLLVECGVGKDGYGAARRGPCGPGDRRSAAAREVVDRVAFEADTRRFRRPARPAE